MWVWSESVCVGGRTLRYIVYSAAGDMDLDQHNSMVLCRKAFTSVCTVL